MKLANAIVKYRIPILILAIVLLIPATIGYVHTRVNYDMLDYLPTEMDTVIGQNELLEDFGKGAFSFIIVENMPEKDVAALKAKIEQVDHVETVLWYDTIADLSVPMELLPKKLYQAFNTENATMMAVFFDSSTSADITMDAIREIRTIAGTQCHISGMSALVTDLKDICEEQEPIYVGLAVAFALAAMMLLLDGWLVPFVFLASIGIMILLNLGSNYLLGEISYITKAMAAVLQLAVTMDYSIFLWHSYNEQLESIDDHKEAMAAAIHETFTSVLVGCVTVLPAMILLFDKPLQKTKHRSIIPNMRALSEGLVKRFPIFLIIFALLIPPALYGYRKTNSEVYYDMASCLPDDMAFVIANTKLQEDFDIASTHMLLVSADTPQKDVRSMIREMETVDGVKYVLGMESVVGSLVPEEMLPESLSSVLKSDRWELLLINSEYHAASDAVNEQIDALNAILKRYDPSGMLIGEAPCMKDMIETTDHDFQVVNLVSILAIFVIIALVEKSITLPFILIAVIEAAIFINLGLPHYLGQSLPFIAPICISTIQLGATVDYAILMTTRYKSERIGGNDKREAVKTALTASIPSIIVSGMGLFAATFGVAIYSDVDIISSMCMLMARGALISVLMVIFALPALLLLCDPIICKTTADMRLIPGIKNNRQRSVQNES